MTRPRTPSRHRLAVAALVTTTLAASVGAGGLTASARAATPSPTSTASTATTAAASGKPQKVIVLLRDQHTDVPATSAHLGQRQSLIAGDQASLLATLRKQGVKGLHTFTTLNGFAATLTPAQITALGQDSRVAAVVPDTVQPVGQANAAAIAGEAKAPAASSSASPHTVAPSGPQSNPLCGTTAAPKLEPEALSTTHDLLPDGTGAQQIATGKGVTVAFIADGVDPTDPDFVRNGKSIVQEVDLTGDPADPEYGAEAFGDASAIGAQGNSVYDISDYNNPAVSPVGPPGSGCDIKIVGMAPGANIIGIDSTFYTSNLVEGVDYAVSHHVDVLNESFGGNPTPDSGSQDAIQLANDAAVAAGITVTVSSGDAGTTGTNGSPSTDSNVISVGASTDSRIYEQTGYAATKFSNGSWTDNNISSLSSGGVTDSGAVPDLVAPGEADWALCSTNVDASPECASLYGGKQNGIQPFGGTSQSAPLTAGAAALVIQAYRDSHKGASPSPALVKTILTSSATDLAAPAYEQGAGLLNAQNAVDVARSVPTENSGAAATKPVGQSLLISPSQINLTGTPGTTQTVPLTVTNLSSTSQTVVDSSRVFTPQSDATQTVALNSTTDTPFTYVTGAKWVEHMTTFTVPSGADRLALRAAWQGAPQANGKATVTPVVRFTLLDPSGTYVANSRPQGGAVSANYANLDVRRPVAGTWTAILYTPAGTAGYTGPVLLDTSTQLAVPGDAITPPSKVLAPGASEVVSARVVVPTSGGDTTESFAFGASGGVTPSVPVVLRTLVEVSKKTPGTFTGTITGGNARAQSPTQTASWAFDVPKKAPGVAVDLTLASDPNVLVEGALVSPDGEVVAVGTNQGAKTGELTRTLQVSRANATPGRYRFILVVENPVSGKEISQNFTGTVALRTVTTNAPKLPSGDTIKRGKSKTIQVSVTNPGTAPIAVQIDPRSTEVGTVALTPIGGSATVDLPAGATPEYLVPPSTSSLTMTAQSSVAGSQAELEGPLLAPDLLGTRDGDTSVVTDTANEVGNGLWLTSVQEVLPPGATTVDGTTTVSTTAQTELFDTSVTSSTGDPWLQSVQAAPTGTSADGGTPVIIGAGKTKTITVTITPTAPKGTTVSGVLNLVSFTNGGPYLGVIPFVANSTLGALPYSYKVG